MQTRWSSKTPDPTPDPFVFTALMLAVSIIGQFELSPMTENLTKPHVIAGFSLHGNSRFWNDCRKPDQVEQF